MKTGIALMAIMAATASVNCSPVDLSTDGSTIAPRGIFELFEKFGVCDPETQMCYLETQTFDANPKYPPIKCNKKYLCQIPGAQCHVAKVNKHKDGHAHCGFERDVPKDKHGKEDVKKEAEQAVKEGQLEVQEGQEEIKEGQEAEKKAEEEEQKGGK